MIFASYINTNYNCEANKESRRVDEDIEWTLSNVIFQIVTYKHGSLYVDFFASNINKKFS